VTEPCLGRGWVLSILPHRIGFGCDFRKNLFTAKGAKLAKKTNPLYIELRKPTLDLLLSRNRLHAFPIELEQV
jgi:hypothetical protein